MSEAIGIPPQTRSASRAQAPIDSAIAALREQIRDAAAARRALCIRGGGTKEFYGETPTGELLDMRACRGIVSYDPSELVMRVRCGTPLAQVEQTLAASGQILAFEPPVFGTAATIGGVVAAGLSGPRRATAGSVRDFVLGVTILDAQGRELRFGGEVMKNVAGYDVSRLMCGSLGILGPIVEVALKVLPRPACEATLVMRLSQAEALREMNRWSGEPTPLSATLWHDGECRVRLSGARPSVESAIARFQRDYAATPVDGEEAAHSWKALRDHRSGFFDDAQPLWRLSLPSTAPPADLPGATLLEWAGAQRWLKTDADAHGIRAACERLGGTATLFRGGGGSVPVFHPLAAANASVHRRLKEAFDPQRLFNPGRLFPYL